MSYYVYESHLGGYFTTTQEFDTYCESCGDSDMLLGIFDTETEAEICKLEAERELHE